VNLNQKGIDLIKQFESLQLKPYICPAGKLTIGYGHVIIPPEHYDEITEDKAEELLQYDCEVAAKRVRKCVKVPLNDNQFSALVSFEFNTGKLADSTLLKMLNAGNIEGAENEFPRWNKARVNGELRVLDGLTRRRALEAMLFSLPV
jgi:lysozyme